MDFYMHIYIDVLSNIISFLIKTCLCRSSSGRVLNPKMTIGFLLFGALGFWPEPEPGHVWAQHTGRDYIYCIASKLFNWPLFFPDLT